MTNIPYGYCHCGCGQRTNIATRTRADMGCIKGEPVRFILGHRTPPVRKPFANEDGTFSVPLTRGKVAIIDAADKDIVGQYHWYAAMPSRTWYAVRNGPSQERIYLHRFLMSPTGSDFIDHADGDGLNNTRVNLRICSSSQNMANKGPLGNNTSGFKGVSLTEDGTYDVRISFEGQQHYLGRFSTPQEAAMAYDAAATEIHGEFAKTNYPVRKAS